MNQGPSIPPAPPTPPPQRTRDRGARVSVTAAALWLTMTLAPASPGQDAKAETQPDGSQPATSQPATPQTSESQPAESRPVSEPNPSGTAEPGSKSQATRRLDHVRLVWPKDKGFAIATVDGTKITLEELVEHIESRHFPGFRGLIAAPSGKLTLQSVQMATWARNFASIVALRREAEARGLKLEEAQPALSNALKVGFERWLLGYRQTLARQGREFDPSNETINQLLTKYQLDFGLTTELQGWLDFIVPEQYEEHELYAYHQKHGRVFGGLVTVSHILIHTRDPFTGLKLQGEDRKAAIRKVEEVRVRLKRDGSNFEELAQRYSDDGKTAARGGTLRNIPRFDPKLPAIMARTAWFLSDGEVSGSFESPFGTHFMKRLEFNQRMFPVYTPDMKDKVSELLCSRDQETLLFDVRRERQVELGL